MYCIICLSGYSIYSSTVSIFKSYLISSFQILCIFILFLGLRTYLVSESLILLEFFYNRTRAPHPTARIAINFHLQTLFWRWDFFFIYKFLSYYCILNCICLFALFSLLVNWNSIYLASEVRKLSSFLKKLRISTFLHVYWEFSSAFEDLWSCLLQVTKQ